MTTVLVVDDHVLVRQSIVKAIRADGPWQVVGEAGDGASAVRLAAAERPDIVLLDVSLGEDDGLEVAARIRQTTPETRIVFLTMHTDDATIRRAVGLAADGFISKAASSADLLNGLEAVASGSSYIDPSVASRVMAIASGRDDGPLSRLTDRELEILRMIARGRRPTEVADRLFVSVKTVKNHLTSIYSKLGVTSGAQAVAAAYRQGLAGHLSPR